MIINIKRHKIYQNSKKTELERKKCGKVEIRWKLRIYKLEIINIINIIKISISCYNTIWEKFGSLEVIMESDREIWYFDINSRQ